VKTFTPAFSRFFISENPAVAGRAAIVRVSLTPRAQVLPRLVDLSQFVQLLDHDRDLDHRAMGILVESISPSVPYHCRRRRWLQAPA